MIRISLIEPSAGAARPVAPVVRVSAGVLLMTLLAAITLWVMAASEQSRLLAGVRQGEEALATAQAAAEKVVGIEAQVEQLQTRLVHIDALRQSQARPSRLLQMIARSVPRELWLLEVRGDLSQATPAVQIDGRALTLPAVTSFTEALRAELLSAGAVDLLQAVTEQVGGRDVVRFSARIEMVAGAPR
jgi:Tfp pilus assembly protein PilN